MPNLLTRLASQLSSKGVKNSSSVAAALLTKRGQMKNGKLTASGKKRQALGAGGRAIDRAAKASGHKANEFKYNKKTNRATLK